MSYIRVQRRLPLLLSSVLFAFVLIGIVLTIAYGWLATVLVSIAAVAVLPTVLQRSQAPQQVATRVETTIDMKARERRLAVSVDGTERTGLVVPLAQEHVWDLLLTRDGYVLVDETGRVRHTMKNR